MAEIDGARLVARCLKQQGIDELFGVVGVPVTGIAAAAPSEGIRYIGTRHEQAAGYAAQAMSYLKGRIGACIVVSGPGMTLIVIGQAKLACKCLGELLAHVVDWGVVQSSLESHGRFPGSPTSGTGTPLRQMGGTG